MDYEKLYSAYYMQVYSYIMVLAKNKDIAEEITQNTFYKAMTSKSKFNVINYFIGDYYPWPKLNLTTWNIDTVDGNTKWLMLIAGVAVGMVLILIGIMRKGKKDNK